MKKYYSFYRYIAIFMCAITLFLSFPFNSMRVVHASGNSWDNFIDFIRTNIGFVSVSDDTLSGTNRGDFYVSLYSTSLVWIDNGNHFTFIPSSIFSKSEWLACCNAGGSAVDSRFNDFNIQECLIMSDYVTDTGSEYHLQNFPSLSDSQDTVSPLEGVKVISDFSGYDNFLQDTYYSSDNITFFDTLKNDFLSNYDNLILITGHQVLPTLTTSHTAFISFTIPVDYIYLCYTNYKNYIYYHSNNQFYSSSQVPSFYAGSNSGKSSYSWVPTTNDLGRISSPSYTFSNLNVNASSGVIPSLSGELSVWSSSIPIVIASTPSYGQQYYTWLNGSPSGDFYTSSNISNNTYSYDYVNNNNWEEIYNNYVTDVSNYYSSTENITNQQLSQYIDHSTTITNITNNYITNGGGDSGDDIITNSWLERIYQEVVKIKNILLGRYQHDSGDTYITDNSVKNEIFNFPTDEIFPDLDPEDMVQPNDFIDGIPWDLLKAKIAGLIEEVIPFCYIFFIGSVFETLVAPPSPPYFEIPFVIESFNINETVILDMSDSAWEIPHNIWIALIWIIFVIFLFELSRKVIMLFTNMFN